MRFGQIGKQSGRALFQNVQHQLEAGCSSIVRIGDMVVNTATAEIRHQTDLGRSLFGRSQFLQPLSIGKVHADDIIESFEILILHRTGERSEIVAPTSSVCTHSGIGLFPLMVIAQSGRIDVEAIGMPLLFYIRAKDSLGRRRATDVAEAYE